MMSFGENFVKTGDPDDDKHSTVVSLPKDDIELLTHYIHHEPRREEEHGLKQMMDTWETFIQPEDLPTEKITTRDTDNFFACCCDASGDIIFIDGDTKEVV